MTFEEDLINQVRLHPVVWNKKSEDYKNRLKSEKAWDIIARNVNKTKKQVKTRWQHLRDIFLKELKKVRKPPLEIQEAQMNNITRESGPITKICYF
ncbi:unnamed protein product [Acanthoscelides obtectus]|uniref:MADF domain-containing protein n=1 Tax=Acanthoscelides obtectus TaxID=200917 RepID=A0A9P0LX25_ACAOB|nr:unnamed protein product [Acanthoscelides obtectus]CAK1672304.1 hypothetical protein AOBTE_LOCUS28770 [Acanthoscelides obtectus]